MSAADMSSWWSTRARWQTSATSDDRPRAAGLRSRCAVLAQPVPQVRGPANAPALLSEQVRVLAARRLHGLRHTLQSPRRPHVAGVVVREEGYVASPAPYTCAPWPGRRPPAQSMPAAARRMRRAGRLPSRRLCVCVAASWAPRRSSPVSP
eukprot:5221554-Pleurochrysis_carterae.AAC.1